MTAPDGRRLDGRVAIVTGATGAMGRAIARRLALEGSTVIGLGRSASRGEAIAAALRGDGLDVSFLRTDLAEPDDVEAAVAACIERAGQLDIVVNNAAATDVIKSGGSAPIVDESVDTLEHMFRVGVVAPFLLFKHAIAHMLSTGRRGSFVSLSTAGAGMAVRGMPSYAASKGALEALARQVALDYGSHGIRSNVIVLGAVLDSGTSEEIAVRTELAEQYAAMRMVPEPGSVHDVASAVAYLASDEARFVTAASIPVDGGLTSKLVAADSSQAFRTRHEPRRTGADSSVR